MKVKRHSVGRRTDARGNVGGGGVRRGIPERLRVKMQSEIRVRDSNRVDGKSQERREVVRK